MRTFSAIALFVLVIEFNPSVRAQTVSGAVIGPTYYAAAYGVVAGAGDQCGANLNSLMAAVNATGGSIVLDAGITLLSTCNFTGSNALGANVFLIGRGAANTDQSNHPPATPPAVLKMTYAGTDVAHIECLTLGGQCGAQNLTVQDDTTSTPFFLYTSGIPYLNNVTCWGENDRTMGKVPDNDCVWLGNGSHYTCSGSGTVNDGFCDYGNMSQINISVQNTRRALVFGANANGIGAYVRGNYSDAYVDSMLNPVGGLVEFIGITGGGHNYTAYGNRVTINAEMAPYNDMGHCNYRGAARFVAYGQNNIVVADGSDDGNCDYIVYVEDSTSSLNDITVQVGHGDTGTGCVLDAGPSNYSNTIKCMPNLSFGIHNLDAVHIGVNIPTNDMIFGAYTVTGMTGLPPGASYEIAWISDSDTGDCATGGGMIKVLCFFDGMQWVPMGNLSSPTFKEPAIGDATAFSLLATGIVDGQAPVTTTNATTFSLGATYRSGYTFNQETTANAAVQYTLPTPTAGGGPYCISNSYTASISLPTTGPLTLKPFNASSQAIIFTDGMPTSSPGGFLRSSSPGPGASICVVGINSSYWQVVGQPVGTWNRF